MLPVTSSGVGFGLADGARMTGSRIEFGVSLSLSYRKISGRGIQYHSRAS